ncbi:AbrB/MazE/SpoVT family DNA-binding domain-containing protein [Halosolutus gelatinilyticus]|uniref:AbrB/MazE/SpoVT family DNA-binding domain-containing protein n=1 Tax=Halosolutus gelatinilyticus TaxID=2931975 RepID=UPI001FF3D8D6|nr:AbrB/MazE/SpoVT family DNA-binding domain-containing protein [Halosolutus gelatinilyticus]
MTDDSDRSLWFPPAMFAEQMQEAGEQVAESQQEMMKRLMQASSNPLDTASAFGPMNMGTATFKARVQSGGRISIPGPEREALDIEEGDIVQTIVVPVKRDRDD